MQSWTSFARQEIGCTWRGGADPSVQQEIGFPYVPSTFQYGTSLPFSRDVIGAEVRRKLGDLRKRAGAGPTCEWENDCLSRYYYPFE